MKPGDLVKLCPINGRTVALWNVLQWQSECDGKEIVAWFQNTDVGIVLAVAAVKQPWPMQHLLVLCGDRFGWQGKTFFAVVP
jgi:hypothetical protein